MSDQPTSTKGPLISRLIDLLGALTIILPLYFLWREVDTINNRLEWMIYVVLTVLPVTIGVVICFRNSKWASSFLEWLFHGLDKDWAERHNENHRKFAALKKAGGSPLRRFLIWLGHSLLKVLRWFLLLLAFGAVFGVMLITFTSDLLAPVFKVFALVIGILLAPVLVGEIREPLFLAILLALLIGSPLYLARDLFKEDGGDVTDPSDGIGCAIALVVFIPAWLVVLALLAYFYLTWLQVILAVLCVPLSLIAASVWSGLKGKRIR